MPSRNRNTDLRIHVGQRIRVRRSLMGISRKDFAKQINKSTRQLIRYENGETGLTMPVLNIIANELGVSVDYFFQKAVNNTKPATRSSARKAICSPLIVYLMSKLV